jgi:hypothetical protein
MTRKARKGRLRFIGRPVGLLGRATRAVSAQPAERVPAQVVPDCDDGGCPFCEVLDQWICHCGAINENSRTFCRYCGCQAGTSTWWPAS